MRHVARAILILVSIISTASGAGSATAVAVPGAARDARRGPTSPLPDPAERAAFQKQELERYAKWAGVAKAQATPRSRLQDRYDAKYYRLSLDLRDIEGESITGDLLSRVLVTEGPLDTLLFDLRDSMPVDSVLIDGVGTPYAQQDVDLTILPAAPLATGRTVEVRIYYHGHPAAAGFGAFGWWSHNGTPIIWSLSEPEGAREWWPCKDRPDDKADSTDVYLRGPDWMVSTSNGRLVEETTNEDGSHTFHWRHRYPITTYLLCVTATNYQRIVDRYFPPTGDSMLIEHFVYPERYDAAVEDFSITPEAIGAFAERFGPYPFLNEKYGHTLFPWGGGMEHQTNTSYGAALVTGYHSYDWVAVHELSHQWWGDMTSPADWRDVWLNEGFASWAEAVWYEHLSGTEAYRDYMTNVQVVFDPSGPIYDPADLFDSNTVYNKGAWAVHMLRGVLGDQVFYDAFHEYRARTAYRSTTTAEFQSILEEVSGRDLDWFFQSWIYGINRPHYSVSFLPIGPPGVPSVAIHLEQTQDGWGFFTMPVDLRIDLSGGGSVTKRLWNDPEHLDVEYDLPGVAANVVVDPDRWILKELAQTSYTMNITTTDLPEGNAGATYQTVVIGRGGEPPYTWSPVDPLPPGLSLDPVTGVLSGTAPDSGLYVFTLHLRDRAGREDSQLYRWTVVPQPLDTGGVDVPAALSLNAGPIPARVRMGFTIASPAGQPVALTIFDPSGRRIRDLWNGAAPARAVSWDGRDGQGREVGSGIYLARLSSASGSLTRRIVWIR